MSMSVMNRITEKFLPHWKRKNAKLAVGLLCLFCVLNTNYYFWDDDGDAVDEFWSSDSFANEFTSRSLSIEEASSHHPYETLINPSQIDFSVDERLSYPESEDNCNDILLYMPYEHSINGQGAQLNAFIKVSLLATFLNKALVVLEAEKFDFLPEWSRHMPASSLYDSGSQFGCPADAFLGEQIDPDFPMGLSRLIQHPRWVGRGCPVPTCGGSMNYNGWEAERLQHKHFMRKNKRLHDVDCVEGDRHVKVTTLGSSAIIQAFNSKTGVQFQMIDRSTPESRTAARLWAMRLGASELEAQEFSEITSPSQIWDFLSALVNRSGLIRFQPWVARDVQDHIQSMNLPLDGPYDAFHVRRGDKLIKEAQEEVKNYWRSKGRLGKTPTNYIPFSHYIEKAWGVCKASVQVARRNLKDTVKTTYIATDDPITVHQEINTLPRVNGKGASIVDQCNHKVNFVFAPTSKGTTFHINDRPSGDDCHQVYKRNIAAIADLVILTRADKFVGDFNSNWGRFIKITRSFLNTDSKTRPYVVKKPMVVAFGDSHSGIPGS
jgi:hypothetical protein